MRKILLFALLALCADAWAQPDTVWSREYADSTASYFAIFSDGHETALGGARIYNIPPPILLQDAIARKIDSVGHTSWTRSLTNNSSNNQGVHSVFRCADGSFLFVGWIGPGVYYTQPVLYNPTLWCISNDGFFQWSRTFQFDTSLVSPEILREPFCSDENGYFIVGGSQTTGNGVLLRLSLDGDSLWTSYLSPRQRNILTCVAKAHDGGLLIGGQGSNPGGFTQAFILKTDSMGNIECDWLSSVGRSQPLQVFQDGNEIVASGRRTSAGNVNYTWQVRLDSNCNVIRYEEQQHNDYTTQFAQTHCGNSEILLATYIHASGQFLTRLTSDFEQRWQLTYSSGVIRVIKELADGSFIWAGNRGSNIWVARTVHDNIESVGSTSALPQALSLYPAFPNPFNPSTTLSFDIAREMDVSLKAYDILGKEVATLVDGRLSAGTHEVEFNGQNLPSGIYFCRLQAGEFSQTQKLMLLK